MLFAVGSDSLFEEIDLSGALNEATGVSGRKSANAGAVSAKALRQEHLGVLWRQHHKSRVEIWQ